MKASPLSQIAPVTDSEAARLVRSSTLADLAGQITATAGPAPSPRTSSPRRSHRRRRIALVATPLAAGLAAVAVVIATQPNPAAPARTVPPGSAQLTAALSFTTSGGYITVIVRDPLADPSRYRAEFAAHHLHVTLSLVPASPSLVGTLVSFSEPTSGGIIPITARGRCYTGGGGSACPVGVRIPTGFRGQAELVFGRAARPGEQYESTAAATAPGEVMHGMRFQGLTVARVLAMLRQRDVTVPVFNYDDHGDGKLLRGVPGGWYVYDADPWAPQQVMLFVGPVWPEPTTGTPAPGTPIPSPTAAG
ncbi:MAG TPA: hypothetical protein VN969_07255 [Streptosporangiaceae bacterium]|nr:hypothetical protein [Streptosporangiaceae bacterium]